MGSIPMVLRLMAHLSAIVAVGVIVMNLGGTMMLAGSPLAGINRFMEIWSPFNPREVASLLLPLAPVIVLYALSDWVDKRS
jgi:hypothetical protein